LKQPVGKLAIEAIPPNMSDNHKLTYNYRLYFLTSKYNPPCPNLYINKPFATITFSPAKKSIQSERNLPIFDDPIWNSSIYSPPNSQSSVINIRCSATSIIINTTVVKLEGSLKSIDSNSHWRVINSYLKGIFISSWNILKILAKNPIITV
jgi:hypothetical protein